MDMEKLKKSIIYVERMANGFNPVKNIPLEDNTILNDANVIRCLYFIKDILKQVYNNNGKIGRNRENKFYEKSFDYSLLKNFKYKEDLTITRLFKQINELITDETMEPLKAKQCGDYLLNNDYLEKVMQDNGRYRSKVTEKGKLLGIYMEDRQNEYGVMYEAVVYGKVAQEFIVENMKSIMDPNANFIIEEEEYE